MAAVFSTSRRMVIKVGSALVTGNAGIRTGWMQSLADDIAGQIKQGRQVVLVSSGAVALGRKKLGVGKRPLKLAEKQAAAACGQVELMKAWGDAFAGHQLQVAQLLLTLQDSDNRRRYLNARHTIETLLKQGIIPVVNENDTVATAELRFGDNDRLAARVAQMAGADLLVLLSDVDGLYTANPQLDATARHIPLVEAITPEIEAMAGGAGSAISSGGMTTKLAAARIAMDSGCHTLIADGREDHALQSLAEGGRHSLFRAAATPEKVRKHWLTHVLAVAGSVTVDEGAEQALRKGASLLAAGATAVQGNFMRGDALKIINSSGTEIGRGLVGYTVEEARLILGKKTEAFPPHLKEDGRSELIYRDDMVIYH